MNGIYLYFVNIVPVGRYWDFKEYFKTLQIFIILEEKQVLVDHNIFPSEIVYDKPLSENHWDQNID